MTVAQSVVAALGIVLLFQSASALRPCSWDIYGDKTDNDIQLGENVLPAGIPTFKVDIPDVCYGYTAGVKVTACDYDDPPQVLVISRSLAYISRKGSLSLNGRVTAKVYCYEDPILSLSSNEKEPPLSVHPLLDSRRAYRRATRSSENSHHVLNRIRSHHHQASNDDQRSTRLSNNNQADESARDNFSAHNLQSSSETRLQQQELSRNNQAAVANTRNQSIRKALAAHIRNAAVEQARHQAAQKSRVDENSSEKRQKVINRSLRHALHGSELNSASDAVRTETAHQNTKDVVASKRAQKTSHSEHTTDEQRLAEQKRSRRDVKSADNRQDDEDINDASEETGSRSGSEHSNSLTREFSPTNDVVRQVLAANARQAAIAEASLRAINEARLAAQHADARQANDVVRQTLKANALHSALAQASLQAMHEAMSRSAQANNVRQESNTNHVASDNERQDKQAHLLAARLLSHDSQRDYSSASNNYGERDTAAETARNPNSNQGYRSTLHDAQRSNSQTRIALDARRAHDRLRQKAEENADEAALSHTHRAAINDALRTSHISAMTNDRHSSHALRNQFLDSTLQNNNYKAHLSDKLSDIYQQSGHRILRRASHSSEAGQAVDSSRDTKSEKVRQSHTSKETANNARIAEQKTDQQHQDLQKRSRRALQFKSNQQVADSFESPLANERYRNSQFTNPRLISDSVHTPSTFDRRQAALNEAHFQFLLQTSRSGQAGGAGKINNNVASTKTEQNAFNHAHRQALLDGQRNTEGIGTQREYNNQAHQNLVSDEQQDAFQTIQAASRYSLLPNSQHLTDAFRNAHEALIRQANLQALHEASRAGETSHLRHLNNLARESLLHNTENTLGQALGYRHQIGSDSTSDILRETARRAEKARKQAFDERLRNVGNDARDLGNNLQDSFADTARRFNLNQMHSYGLSKDHLSGATDVQQLADSVRNALAETAHRATLDQVRNQAFGERGFNTGADAFHSANNIQKSLAETVDRANINQARHQTINEGRLSATMNARQRADHVRESLADIARRATFDQARHQKLSDSHQGFNDGHIGSATDVHQIADNVRQALAETARRANLDQALQQSLGGVQLTGAHQTADSAGQTLRDIARRAALNQARLLASSEKGNVRQFLSSDLDSQKQAAYEESLNRQLSLQNSNLQGRYF